VRTLKSKSIGEALHDLVNDLGISGRLREYTAVTVWPEAVGGHIASMTEAKSIRNGVLVVKVKSAPWRQELLLRKKELLGNLNDLLGENVVRDITLI
jgi:predicted nucleic acid-binding Zn ribbon protein